MPVWKLSMDAATTIFNLTDNLPKKEDYGLTSQIRRSALSISSNIAEAFGRKHNADKVNFYYFARGSITETLSHLEYSKRVGYISEEAFINLDLLLKDIHEEINKIIVSLKSKPKA
jgi:four helix bundle protein